jgi:hypothetical protein
MAAELKWEAAQSLAASLTTIGHPFQTPAIQATAQDLMRWCTGAIRDGRAITAEQQAATLVNEARMTWDGWPEKGGTKQLFALFQQLFGPAESLAAEFRAYETPPPAACKTCDDTGWETIDQKGCDFARPCRACGGKRRPVLVCPECSGKETRLVGGVRQPCRRCLTPERRREISEWLQQQAESA